MQAGAQEAHSRVTKVVQETATSHLDAGTRMKVILKQRVVFTMTKMSAMMKREPMIDSEAEVEEKKITMKTTTTQAIMETVRKVMVT
jgi:hypothetical protein